MSAPTLNTPRLTLRGHVMADLKPLIALLGSDRARYMGGPFSRREAWQIIAADTGSWDLIGMGGWALEDRDGTLLGQVGVNRPEHFPEVELGWMLLPEAEGKGYALEAAEAVLDWVRDALRPESLVSYIHVENQRSIALATRLGAIPDPDADMADGDTPQDTVVYRYALDADGSPEAYA